MPIGLQNRGFGHGLPFDHPPAEQRDLDQRDQAGSRDQQSEHAPGIAHAIRRAGEHRSADDEAQEIGRQHDGEGEAARADELHDRLRPHHLVAERNAAGERIETERKPGVAGHADGRGLLSGRSARRDRPVERERAHSRREIDHGRRDGGAFDAEPGNQEEGRQKRAEDRAGGVGGIQEAARRADSTVTRCERPDQTGEVFRPSGTAGCRPARKPAARRAQAPGFQAGEERGDLPQTRRSSRCRGRQCPPPAPHRGRIGRATRSARRPSKQASEPKTGKEGAHRGRHRVDIDADDERKLLDPEHLVDQRGRARHEQQQREDGSGVRHRSPAAAGEVGHGAFAGSGSRLTAHGSTMLLPPLLPAVARPA